ncbi:MAG TPA: hypothetical protein DIC64_00955 [Alphaproteobacteria bacterium]|nr:hypothetical protein [Alphaproteobacteria bacterium]
MKTASMQAVFTFVGLILAKSDFVIHENVNFAQIIGLLKKCHPFFALAKIKESSNYFNKR